MNSDSEQLAMTPFPIMDWDGECWEGATTLAFGTNVGLSVYVNESSSSRSPSLAQSNAFQYHLDHGDRIIENVLKAIESYYWEMRPRYVDFLGDEIDELMPLIEDRHQLRELIDLRQVHIHTWENSEFSYVGLLLGCKWDVEHGLGVILHRDSVVDIGGADTSFCWSPDTAGDSNETNHS